MTPREVGGHGAGASRSPTSRARLERRRAAAAASARRRAAELGRGRRHRWRVPVLQAVALAAILSVDGVVLAGVQADLAADRGIGPRVAVAAVVDDAVAPPVRLSVPALGVKTRLIGLRKDRSGALQVPEDAGRAGWYSQGFAPGGDGPAVIVGHVDSYRGPGIFARLGAMRAGQLISIRRADGSLAVFEVRSVETFAKRDFPTERVYRGDGTPALRLVTCGGEFDRGAKSYRSNVVVFAVPHATAPPEAAPTGPAG